VAVMISRRRLEGHPRLSVIPHELDVGGYYRPLPKEDFLLLFRSNLCLEKGLHTAIAAAWRPKRQLVCAGPVSLRIRGYLMLKFHILGPSGGFFFVGPADFNRNWILLNPARAAVVTLEVD